jgi:hypothetical protein
MNLSNFCAFLIGYTYITKATNLFFCFFPILVVQKIYLDTEEVKMSINGQSYEMNNEYTSLISFLTLIGYARKIR